MFLPFVSPLEIVNQTVVLIVVVVIVAMMIRHWDKVMVAITGDDRLHGTSLDLIYFLCFQCCGTCTGDWTRSWTRRCCCCHRRGEHLNGINLVTEVGRLIGITTCTVELKNIVCGDLPWDQRADFYISVECAANPPMVTSLAEEKLPKVVHFPEVITLRLRWNPLEEKVRITVKELNLFGSTDLCQVHIPAMSIIDWSSSEQEQVKRFEMKPIDASYPSETAPWILLEFGSPSDERGLDDFHGQVNTVRTSTSGKPVDRRMRDFKQAYTLLDNTGHVLQEPLEDDLEAVAYRLWVVSTLQYGSMCWGTFLLLALGFLRIWVGLCYRRYRHVTMALLNNQTFPMSDYELGSFVSWCHASVDGEGQPFGVPCKPSFEQVLSVCRSDEEGGRYPKQQPPVLAFEGLIKRTGLDTGLPCGSQRCHLNKAFQDYDVYAPVVIAIYLLLICGVRICGNKMVLAKKHSLQHLRAEQTREYHEYASSRGHRGGTNLLSAA